MDVTMPESLVALALVLGPVGAAFYALARRHKGPGRADEEALFRPLQTGKGKPPASRRKKPTLAEPLVGLAHPVTPRRLSGGDHEVFVPAAPGPIAGRRCFVTGMDRSSCRCQSCRSHKSQRRKA